jgi:hypothetical protein
MATTPSIEVVWSRIRALEGERFETKSGEPFSFSIKGNVLRTDRARQNLGKAQFERVLSLVPIDGPGAISNLVRGPAYVWAVLHDSRVRQGDW